MSLYTHKHELYENYIRELHENVANDDIILSSDGIWEECENYINSSECKWENIFYDDILIGFIIIGHDTSVCPEGCDRIILDCYVDPGYRNLRLFEKVFVNYILNRPKIWCYRCLKADASSLSTMSHIFQYCMNGRSSMIRSSYDDKYQYFFYKIS